MVKVRKRDGRLVELKRDGRIVELKQGGPIVELQRDGPIVEYVEANIEADARRGGATGEEAAPVAKDVAARRNVNTTPAEALIEPPDATLITTTDPPEAATIGRTPAIPEILRTVPPQEGFHFYTAVGQPTSLIATSLSDFVEKLREVDGCSVHFHFTRQDFEKWIRDVIRDADLATTFTMIHGPSDGEALRTEISQIVQARLGELTRMS